MNKQEVEFLIDQIRNIILNKPISTINAEGDFGEMQAAISYLADCLSESNLFLKEISSGNLNVTPPSRKNFLAGSLKEMHAGLRHLTWQANQVAKGDYNQSVSFLGEFSSSFNKMISQLQDREEKLKLQSHTLSQANMLMESIMDGISDMIFVVSQDERKLIYLNKSAVQMVSGKKYSSCKCGYSCALLKQFINQNEPIEGKDSSSIEFHCVKCNLTFKIDTFSLHWNSELSYVNKVVDITHERQEQIHMQDLAYKDELTGLFNRRYCMEKMESLINEKRNFTFCLNDVDNLKYVNDTFGHIEGDTYLKIIANYISNATRMTDVVCRIGGDEFAIIFINCDIKQALEKMVMVNKKLNTDEKHYLMSLSFGAININQNSTLSMEEILEQADIKMYESKRSKKAHNS